jgi:hypothetical protein
MGHFNTSQNFLSDIEEKHKKCYKDKQKVPQLLASNVCILYLSRETVLVFVSKARQRIVTG